MFYGNISITWFLWSDWCMCMQWIPGPFFHVGRGLGTRLVTDLFAHNPLSSPGYPAIIYTHPVAGNLPIKTLVAIITHTHKWYTLQISQCYMLSHQSNTHKLERSLYYILLSPLPPKPDSTTIDGITTILN